MNFIDSLSATIEQLSRLIHRIEYFIDEMLNLAVEELYNAIDSIQNQISDFRREGLAILSSLDPVSLRYAAGYWTRGGLRRRWISYRGRSKRGGRWYRGWGQRRYTWRPHHYQQEHNYSRLARNDTITINVRRGNVLMLLPSTHEAVIDILPLVQPVTWSATIEPSEPLFSVASASQPAAPLPVFALPSRAQLQFTQSPWPQARIALPPVRMFSQRSRAQPFLAHSRSRPFFAQPNRPPRRSARALYRAQPVRLYVHQPSVMEEPNQFAYEPFPIQSGRFRPILTNSWTLSSSIEHSYSVTGGPVAPEQVAPRLVVRESGQVVLHPEREQVVPMPIITDPPNDTI